MNRLPFAILLAALLSVPLTSGAATSAYSDLYGSHCKTIERGHGTRTRRCEGVAGYRLLVHEVEATTSLDIVSPRGEVWPLDYWEVVTPGLARVGRKAEWRMERRGGALVPVALLVRLDTVRMNTRIAAEAIEHGPRMAPPAAAAGPLPSGIILTGARIDRDGACVVYQGNGASRTADAAARNAVAQGRRCLGLVRQDPAR